MIAAGLSSGQEKCPKGAGFCQQDQDCALSAPDYRRGWLQSCAAAWGQVTGRAGGMLPLLHQVYLLPAVQYSTIVTGSVGVKKRHVA